MLAPHCAPRLLAAASVALAALGTIAHAARPASPTVVCLGDSITRAGYPEILATLLPARVVNAGIGGDTTRRALARLDADVLAHRPAAVVLFFGANDSRLDAPAHQVPLPEYEANLERIVRRCVDAGAQVVLASMPPIDPEPYHRRHPRAPYEARGGLRKIIGDYRDAALRVARATGVGALDLNHALAPHPEWMKPDGVHPSPRGCELIARLVADALAPMLGLAPHPVRSDPSP
jgi:lysophospholipase L1-like esterase